MTMIAFNQSRIGLPVIDIGHFLKESINHVHESAPYVMFWGYMAHYMIGLILALIWVGFLQNRIPGNWFIQGLFYGILISIVAVLIVSPLVSRAGEDPFGIFYYSTWIPSLLLLAGLVMHLGYGIVLILCLKHTGIKGKQTEL